MKSALGSADVAFHTSERMRLEAVLREASDKSHLPIEPTTRDALSDMLVRLRLKTVTGGQ